MLNLSQAQVANAVLTGIVHGNKNSAGVANFLAPVVNVTDLTGYTITMNDDAFVAKRDLYRAPGSNYTYHTPQFGKRTYSLNQEGEGWEISQELDYFAKNGAAKLDLRKQALYNVMKRLENSWELHIAETLGDSSRYEASNYLNLALTPNAQWDSPLANVEDQIMKARIIIQRQIGVKPNKLLLSYDAYRALLTNPRIRDFMPRGTMVTTDMLAELFDLNEVQIAMQNVITEESNGRREYLWGNNALLFYAPGKTQPGLIPADAANRAEPSFAYQYVLKGFPIATKEEWNPYRECYFGHVKVFRSLELTGVTGDNGLLAAGFLWDNVAAKTLI